MATRTQIQAIEDFENSVHGSTIRRNRAAEITFLSLIGLNLAWYISSKATMPIVNIEDLPFKGYIEEAWIWVKTVLYPRLRSNQNVWEVIKPENGTQKLIVALTSLYAGAAAWFGHKKRKEIREKNKDKKAKIAALGV